MRFIEKFINLGQKREIPQPEIIDPLAPKIKVQGHALRFYPKFQDFANLWNEYLETDERGEVREELRALEMPMGVESKNNRDSAKELQERILNVQKAISQGARSKAELKKLKKERKWANEKLLQLEKDKEMPLAVDSFQSKFDELKKIDRDFVVGLEGDMPPVFYALEFKNLDDNDLDTLFIQKAKSSNVNQFAQELDLWGLNFQYNSLARRYYKNENIPAEKEEFDNKVNRDTVRQLLKAFEKPETLNFGKYKNLNQ